MTMAKDTTLPLRQAIVTRLKADEALTLLIDGDSIYGMRTPASLTWPFIRYGTPNTLPTRATCWDGAVIRVPIHAFSKAEYEDEAAGIIAAVAKSLDGAVMALDAGFGATAHLKWRGTQVLPDAAEAGAWHAFADFEATVAS